MDCRTLLLACSSEHVYPPKHRIRIMVVRSPTPGLRRTLRMAGGAFALAAVAATSAAAQVVVAGNLGPGNSYQHGIPNSYLIGGSSDGLHQYEDAVNFVYTGAAPAQLYDFAWAVNYFSGTSTIFADFMVGSDINTASIVESGIWLADAKQQGDEFLLFSGSGPFFLQPGETYWIRLRLENQPDDTQWGWQKNDQGKRLLHSPLGYQRLASGPRRLEPDERRHSGVPGASPRASGRNA